MSDDNGQKFEKVSRTTIYLALTFKSVYRVQQKISTYFRIHNSNHSCWRVQLYKYIYLYAF